MSRSDPSRNGRLDHRHEIGLRDDEQPVVERVRGYRAGVECVVVRTGGTVCTAFQILRHVEWVASVDPVLALKTGEPGAKTMATTLLAGALPVTVSSPWVSLLMTVVRQACGNSTIRHTRAALRWSPAGRRRPIVVHGSRPTRLNALEQSPADVAVVVLMSGQGSPPGWFVICPLYNCHPRRRRIGDERRLRLPQVVHGALLALVRKLGAGSTEHIRDQVRADQHDQRNDRDHGEAALPVRQADPMVNQARHGSALAGSRIHFDLAPRKAVPRLSTHQVAGLAHLERHLGFILAGPDASPESGRRCHGRPAAARR